MAISQHTAALNPTGGDDVVAVDEDALQGIFLARGWTDCLPVTIPTQERVAAMLAGSSHAAEQAVGARQPASR